MEDLYSFARRYGLKETRVIDACSGISPLGPSKKVKAAVRKAIKRVGGYPDPGNPVLRKLLASKYGVPANCVLFAGSVSQIISSSQAAFGPGGIMTAGSSPALGCHGTKGTNFRHLDCCGDASFQFDAEKLKAGLGDSRAVIISNPDRVTGRLIQPDMLSGILRAAEEKGVVVIVDEALMEFTGEEGLLSRAPGSGNLLILRTTGAFYGLPGLEVAYAVSSEATTGKIDAMMTCGANSLAVEAARTALKDGAYRKAVLEFIASEKSLFAKELRKIGGTTFFESDSNVFLVGLEAKEERLLKALKREGFFLGEFSTGEGSFLSLSVMAHDHNLKFLRVVRDALTPACPR